MAPMGLDDFREAARAGKLTEATWADFVGAPGNVATITRLADELAQHSDFGSTVRRLRAHAFLRMGRLAAAAAGFDEAKVDGALGRTDLLALAAARRGLGEHAAALAALKGVSGDAPDEDVAFWRAVSHLAQAEHQQAFTALNLLKRPWKRMRTEWLASYLATALGRHYAAWEAPRRAVASRYANVEAAKDATRTFALIDYKSPDFNETSANLGDYMQTLALMRHLARYASAHWTYSDPRLAPTLEILTATWPKPTTQRAVRQIHISVLDRDDLWPAATLFENLDVWTILHGWRRNRRFGFAQSAPATQNVKALVLSYHLQRPASVDPAEKDFLRRSQPIGCRDWPTVFGLLNQGIEAFFSGCLSATLSIGAGSAAPSAAFLVDCEPMGTSSGEIPFSHASDETRRATFSANVEKALRTVEMYAGASGVRTSRLIAYLACRALGTPVEFVPRDAGDPRFDGLVGISAEEMTRMQARIADLLDATLPLILEGAAESEIRARWRSCASPWVTEALAQLYAAPRFFAREPELTPDQRPSAPATLKHTATSVTLSVDRGYLPYAAPLIRSIKENSSTPVAFTFLVRRVTKEDLETPLRLAGAGANVLAMDGRFEDDFVRLIGGATLSTMDRLFLPELLPDCDRVVYVDVDAIVLGDVAELAEFAPSRRGIAARSSPIPVSRLQGDALELAADSLEPQLAPEFRRMIAADVDLSRPWLNAGVLVLSLNRLRALNFTATTLEVVKRFRLHDEQAINIYSRGDFTALPRVWNLMPYADWNDGAKLLHWAGAGQKPWDSSDVRFSELWRRYGGAPKNAHSSTSKGYWSDIANYDFAWDARAKRAAALVAPGSRVLDLGCGRMALRRYLPNRCAYVPADLERWNEEVVAVDLDAGEFPAFDCDVIVMLGVLEHLSDPIAVLKRARAHTKTSIVSYRHPGSESLPESRCARRCVNSFSQNEFAALIARSGWAVRSRQTHDRTNLGLEIIYVLVPNDG